MSPGQLYGRPSVQCGIGHQHLGVEHLEPRALELLQAPLYVFVQVRDIGLGAAETQRERDSQNREVIHLAVERPELPERQQSRRQGHHHYEQVLRFHPRRPGSEPAQRSERPGRAKKPPHPSLGCWRRPRPTQRHRYHQTTGQQGGEGGNEHRPGKCKLFGQQPRGFQRRVGVSRVDQ